MSGREPFLSESKSVPSRESRGSPFPPVAVSSATFTGRVYTSLVLRARAISETAGSADDGRRLAEVECGSCSRSPGADIAQALEPPPPCRRQLWTGLLPPSGHRFSEGAQPSCQIVGCRRRRVEDVRPLAGVAAQVVELVVRAKRTASRCRASSSRGRSSVARPHDPDEAVSDCGQVGYLA
jgi:hypothetical protein